MVCVIVVMRDGVFCFLVLIAAPLYQIAHVTLTARRRCVYQLSCRRPPLPPILFLGG